MICARTDARAIEGLDAAIDRAKAYVDAGADMVFPEALADEAEFAAFRAAIDVPLLANMTEFGKSPLLSAATLESLGFNLVIYPVTLLRLAMGAIEDGLRTLLAEGSQASLVPTHADPQAAVRAAALRRLLGVRRQHRQLSALETRGGRHDGHGTHSLQRLGGRGR